MNPSSIPCSGWLSKLTHSPFGTARWQSRYFVLLDTEMRYYKDEHSSNASKTINLHDISNVIIMTRTPGHPYVFRLEPTTTHRGYQKKVWTIECKSQCELDAWVSVIQFRLSKLIKKEQAGLVSIPENNRQESISMPHHQVSQTTCNKIETAAAMIHPRPRPLKRPMPSISRRRGIVLSRLDVENILPTLENDMLSSSSSSSSSSSHRSSLPSLPTISQKTTSSETITKEEGYQIESKNSVDLNASQDAYIILDSSSPTFAYFKKQFNL
ncbi:uncharacterized protein BX663DRAFT_498276 [Cokeromyces recurvatus]|uniref:uncharacterized protein n=1 Tax=Cokeromyces recurvatus TaxID=90255 RepID=UPI00221F9666|nr:uncharacterized protein BX663DRAFT_498276 [Cokeromyces recurvatus]KAI7905955.1 hypothetical protein BX663DRAFT_498276 [Cokeromyces recurvatus]